MKGRPALAELARDAGEEVVTCHHVRARGKGSGVEVEFNYAYVWRLRAGKIIHCKSFRGSAEALEAAGLSEELFALLLRAKDARATGRDDGEVALAVLRTGAADGGACTASSQKWLAHTISVAIKARCQSRAC